MPTETPHRDARVRVSAYQARIERSLTDVYQEVPRAGQTGEWVLISVAHTNGYASCELCGHTPIKRLFFIEHSTQGTVKMIGSECARNYVRVNLVEAYERTLNREQNRIRTRRQRQERIDARNAAYAARVAERTATNAVWATTHATEVEWLRNNHSGDSFLSSLFGSFEQYGRLTDRQLECVRSNITRAANRTPNSADAAATPDQVPHIYNGIYTMDDGAEHQTFMIYTATRGPLQGKRIVKRQTRYMEFTGFAFVGSDGTLKVWRRFADQTNELYQVWARELLACLNSRTNEAPGIDSIQYHRFTIQRTRRCRRCNRELTVPTSIESGIGPECSRRDSERTTVANPHQAVAAVATAAVPAPIPNAAAIRQQQVAAATRARSLVAAGNVPLSELGTGLIQ